MIEEWLLQLAHSAVTTTDFASLSIRHKTSRVVKKLRRPKNVENRGTFRLLPCTDFGRTSAQVNAGQSIQNAKLALRGQETYVVTVPAS